MNISSPLAYNCCEQSRGIMNGSFIDCCDTKYDADTKLFDLPFGFVIFFVIFNIIVLILTVIGNSAVIYVFVASDAMRNVVNNHFLVSLSLADLLVGLLVMPCAIDALSSNQWRCGEFWKEFSGFGNFCFLYFINHASYDVIRRPILSNFTTSALHHKGDYKPCLDDSNHPMGIFNPLGFASLVRLELVRMLYSLHRQMSRKRLVQIMD